MTVCVSKLPRPVTMVLEKEDLSANSLYPETNFNYFIGDYKHVYGRARRELILKFLSTQNKIYVNSSWVVQLKQDPDLRKLLRQGKIKRIRTGSLRSRHTTIVLA